MEIVTYENGHLKITEIEYYFMHSLNIEIYLRLSALKVVITFNGKGMVYN